MVAEQARDYVLIIGAGVAGLQAAVELTTAGKKVYLVDRSPTLGGLMPRLDRTFPTHDCHMCMIAPPAEDRRGCLRGGVVAERLPGLEILAATELAELTGELGAFRAILARAPRFIAPELCTACGRCQEVCPVAAVSEYNAALEERRAAYLPGPQAVPRVFAIDPATCSRCGACVEACPTGAIDLERPPVRRQVEVGAVILAVGSQVFNPEGLTAYLYGRHPNVITSLALERLLSGTGPTGGRLLRPSDGREPRKIAWLQCIGSRDQKTHPYCSAFCCMSALKEVRMVKDWLPAVEATIFFMDLRATGKGYEPYAQEILARPGVRLVNYRVPELWPAPEDRLQILYPGPEGHKVAEDFDLVVLSVGFEPVPDLPELAARLGIPVQAIGYPETRPWEPVATGRPGIYVCGAAQAPKDIPESVTEAAAAAAAVLADLPPGGAKLATPALPAPAGGDKLAVAFCGADARLEAELNLQELQIYAASLPGVTVVLPPLSVCNPEALSSLSQGLRDLGVARLLLVSGGPVSDNVRWQQVLAQAAGLNPYQIEVLNLRTEVAAVHQGLGAAATAKAKDLLRQAVARLRRLQPLPPAPLSRRPRALVLGGGVAGLTAALHLARMGVEVDLVEKEAQLGGLARRLHRTIEGWEVQPWLADLMAQVEAHPRIQVYLGAELWRQDGKVGSLRTTIRLAGGELRQLSHGAVVVATGAQPYQPQEYLYGQDPRVLTQLELGELLQREPETVAAWRRVVMIQCVGSRNAANPDCSRICCQTAVKHALQLRALVPDLDILVLHRDIRTYGLLEEYYTRAREAKVLFIRFTPEDPPAVQRQAGELTVTFRDNILERPLTYPVDAVILSIGLTAPAGRDLAARLPLPADPLGFLRPAQAKIRPVEALRPGYYICGTAHSPRLLSEAVCQGLAVAAKVGGLLLGPQALINPVVAQVDQGRCAACLACVRACPFQAPQIGPQRKSQIEPELCRGCGVCVAVCPAGAIDLKHYQEDQLRAEIQAAFGA